ncbi:MAG: beta-propeller domain-containing protein [Pirellulales bacterium]|nr:beta-propeller domain-containing protein [Pirellulales bacterium]
MFSLPTLTRRLRGHAAARSASARHSTRRPTRLKYEPLEHRLLLNAAPDDGKTTFLGEADGVPYVVGAAPTYPGAEDALAQLDRFDSAEQLEAHLLEDALQRYEGMFGQSVYPYYYLEFTSADAIALRTASETASAGHSETNTQVDGVDEGDLVETDGEYLYVLSGEELVIVDAWPAEELHVASRVELAGRPFAQYLSGDRLTILSGQQGHVYHAWEPRLLAADWGPYYYSAPPTMTLTVLDVADREAPVLVQQTELDGTCVDSRAIGDSVYLVLSNNFFLPGPQMLPISHEGEVDWGSDVAKPVSPSSDAMIAADMPYYWPTEPQYVYETQEQYLERIEGQILELGLPGFSSFDAEGNEVELGLLSEATDVYRPLSPDDSNLISVVVFDAGSDAPGPVSSTSVPTTYTSEVYMSAESLYLLGTGRYGWFDSARETAILKFDVDPALGSVDLGATGAVPGSVLNQFSIDEHDGYLRVATQQGSVWGGTSGNSVYVLQQTGQSLEIVSRLENLAPGERIYSVRFLGDRAFVVTFRQVDPLFAIDLSDPLAPQVEGELKISGFSNYLHPVDDGFLLGLGREADISSGYYEDPQISLFDVEDLGNPAMLGRFTIPVGRAGGLQVFSEHHAVSYFPEYQVLAVPVTSESTWLVGGDGSSRYVPPRADLWVFRIDTSPDSETGARRGSIEPLGQIEHNTSVVRSVRIGNLLYSISEDAVMVHELLHPETQVASVEFGTSLGTVDFAELRNLNLADYDHWYHFRSMRDGMLTADVWLGEISGGDAWITLYDADHNEITSSIGSYPGSACRLDWDTLAGSEYYLKVSGTGTISRLRLANLVQLTNSEDGRSARFFGTEGSDTFEFESYWQSHGGDSWVGEVWTQAFTQRQATTINGVRYDFSRLVSADVTIDGIGGYDTVTIDITHMADMLPPADQGHILAELHPHSGTITQTGPVFGSNEGGTPRTFSLELQNVGSITVSGGDEARLYDSGGDDELVQWPSGALLSGPGYRNRVDGFATVYAYASDGFDVAKMYDSPGDDELVATPTMALLSGDGFLKRAQGFDAVHVFGTAGGTDVARLYDSPEGDLFSANQSGGALFGNGFYNRAKFFEGVHAYATAGGIDVAKLYDSPGEDTFLADPQQGALWGPGFYNRAKFFEGVHAYAIAGGVDRANLVDSGGDDVYRSDPVQAALFGEGFYNRAKYFEQVRARGSLSGNDRAYLLDSPEADHLEAEADWARLCGDSQSSIREVAAFNFVEAIPSTGRNTKAVGAVDFVLSLAGEWTDLN